MEIDKFAEKVRFGVAEYLGEEYEVRTACNRKNNGVILHGIMITEKDINISPNIYLEGLYCDYERGQISLGEVVGQIIAVYEKHKISGNVDMDFFLDYEKMKNRIVYKLVNYDENSELLKEVPYVRYLDMAVVFYCSILHEIMGAFTILIRNRECEEWKTTSEELYERACKNTPRLLEAQIRDMQEVLEDLSGQAGVENPCDITCESMSGRMYVLSNRQQMFGAACMLYPDVLKQFSKQINNSFYILPSSVHEVILVPGGHFFSADEFERMVREINHTQLDTEEILSDFVYYYNQEEDRVMRL